MSVCLKQIILQWPVEFPRHAVAFQQGNVFVRVFTPVYCPKHRIVVWSNKLLLVRVHV